MPPRPVYRPRRNKDELMAERGMTWEKIEKWFKEGVEPPPVYYKSKPTRGQHGRAIRVIDQFITEAAAEGVVVKLDGVTVHSFQDVCNLSPDAMTSQTFKGWLDYYVYIAKPRTRATFNTDKIKRSTLTEFAFNLMGGYFQLTNRVLPSRIRNLLLDQVKIVGAELEDPPQVRAELTPDSALDLVIAIGSINKPFRVRLSGMTYVVVSTSSGLRASSLLRTSPARERQRALRLGLTYGDLRVWVLPPTTDSTVNDVLVWLKPKWTKTTFGRQTWFPLHVRGKLGNSAAMLILLSGAVDKAWEFDLETILDPAYLKGHGGRRRVRVKADSVDKPLFPSQNSPEKSATGEQMNATFRLGSIVAGFALHVTTHCARYLAAQAVFLKYGLAGVREALQHDARSSATRTYLGRSVPHWVNFALGGEPSKDNKPALELFKSFTRADPDAPKSLPPDEGDLLLADKTLTKIRDQQGDLKAAISRDHGGLANAPGDKRAEYKKMSRDYKNRLDQICLQRFIQYKREYHTKKGLPMNVAWADVKRRLNGQAVEDTGEEDIDVLTQNIHAILEHNPEREIHADPAKANLNPDLRDCLLGKPDQVLNLLNKLREAEQVTVGHRGKRTWAETFEAGDDEEEEGDDDEEGHAGEGARDDAASDGCDCAEGDEDDLGSDVEDDGDVQLDEGDGVDPADWVAEG